MTERQRLPNRRDSEVFEFELDGLHYRAQIARFPDGRLGELFLDGGKVGSAASIAARDGAILASLLLQNGIDVSAIRKTLTQLRNGRSAGPVGRALEIAEAVS